MTNYDTTIIAWLCSVARKNLLLSPFLMTTRMFTELIRREWKLAKVFSFVDLWQDGLECKRPAKKLFVFW